MPNYIFALEFQTFNEIFNNLRHGYKTLTFLPHKKFRTWSKHGHGLYNFSFLIKKLIKIKMSENNKLFNLNKWIDLH